MVREIDEPEPIRFLVTVKAKDADAIDEAAGRLHMSRNRFVILAAIKHASEILAASGCPICGKTETHAH